MLAEFVGAIAKLTNDAFSVKAMKLPGKDSFVVLYPDGTHEEYDQQVLNQSHLTSFVSFLEFIGSENGSCTEVIYYKSGCIQAVCDPTGCDRMTLTLSESSVRAHVMKLQGGQFFPQKELIKFLRFKLFGSVPETLISAFSNVIFDTQNQLSGRVGKNEESLGKMVTSRVEGTENVPDSFVVRYPYYSNEGADVIVNSTVHVDIDKENRGFTLYLEPDGLEKAFHQCHDDLRTRMNNVLVTVESDATVLEGFPQYVNV